MSRGGVELPDIHAPRTSRRQLARSPQWGTRLAVQPAAQLPSALLTRLNDLLLLWPSDATMVMHATRIRASITAYSTAVGPSSSMINRMSVCIDGLLKGLPQR